jgi:hypothetical protein
MNNIFAVAGVVIKELYRRKDFYVLFILTIAHLPGHGLGQHFQRQPRSSATSRKSACCSSGFRRSSSPSPPPRGRFRRNANNRTCCRCWPSRCRAAAIDFGKFLGCWLACGLALLCFYIFFGALAASREHNGRC